MSALIGLDEVVANLNKKIAEIKGKVSESGMLTACLLVRGEAQKKAPVEYGFLKASAYTDVDVSPNLIVGEIGFTEAYAPFVHEKPGTYLGLDFPRHPSPPHKGSYWDPQGIAEPQFLRNALIENEELILKILAESANIG